MSQLSDKHPPSQLRAISREVNKLVDNSFTVNETDDQATLDAIKVVWDDLVSLKNELASQVLNLVHNVTSITANPAITENLVNPGNFSRLVKIFFQDVNDYSSKIKLLREKHEHHTGRIASIAEFEEYNKLAVEYYGLSEELIHVLAPTVTEIVLMSNQDVQTKLAEMHASEQVTQEPHNVQPL